MCCLSYLMSSFPYFINAKVHFLPSFSHLWNQDVSYNWWHLLIIVGPGHSCNVILTARSCTNVLIILVDIAGQWQFPDLSPRKILRVTWRHINLRHCLKAFLWHVLVRSTNASIKAYNFKDGLWNNNRECLLPQRIILYGQNGFW